MKVVALISGGKDSCFNMMHCVANGHEITALANLHPAPSDADEMDSWMFQTVGHDIVHLYSEAMGLPLYRETIKGSNKETALHYNQAEGDETEDLYRLIATVQAHQPDVRAISVGAIASNYQRLRVENVASRLGLVVLSYLWERDQTDLLHEMIVAGVEAVLIKVACVGLDQKHLGKSLAQMEERLAMLHERYEVHPCGEGGEYETIVLDCPLFVKALHVTRQECVELEGDTAYIRLRAEIRDKPASDDSWITSLLRSTKLDCTYEEQLTRINNLSNAFSPPQEGAGNPKTLPLMIDATRTDDVLTCRRFAIQDFRDLVTRFQHVDTSKVIFSLLVMKDMSDFPAVNLEYAKLWNHFHPPSRVCIATSVPSNATCLLYTLERNSLETCCTPDRRLWVQSRSTWAPSNIGPYSQVTVSNGLAFVSGQIGLRPATMEMATTFNEELIWSMQSLERIMKSQKIEAWSGILIVYVLQASSAVGQTIDTVVHEFLAKNKSDILIVELGSGSQLPRNANIELQLIVADRTHMKVVMQSKVMDDLVSLTFSSTDLTGLASIPSSKLLYNNSEVTDLAITFEPLPHSV